MYKNLWYSVINSKVQKNEHSKRTFKKKGEEAHEKLNYYL